MENQFSILSVTLEELRTVGNAMAAVTDYLEGRPSGPSALDNCKCVVELLESRPMKLQQLMDESLAYLQQNWVSIIQSEPWEHEVLVFCDACKVFYEKTTAFDESVCLNDDEGAEILNDWWIARKYFIGMLHWITRAESILDFAAENFKDRRGELGPFAGLAKLFRPFFTGVTDEQLRDFVLERKPIPGRPVWKGERCEGTLMGQELGIDCAEMNNSFNFQNEKHLPKQLKYGSDKPRNIRRSYRISTALDSLIRARDLEKNRPRIALGV